MALEVADQWSNEAGARISIAEKSRFVRWWLNINMQIMLLKSSNSARGEYAWSCGFAGKSCFREIYFNSVVLKMHGSCVISTVWTRAVVRNSSVHLDLWFDSSLVLVGG